MNQKKNIFAILGGIFLMSAGFLSLIVSTISLINTLRYTSLSFGSVILFNLNILLLLCGLFVLLRKPRVAAIMMCVVAGLYVLNILLNVTVNHVQYVWFTVICVILAYGLLAAGMFGKGLYALIMCLGAAFCRFIPFIKQLINYPANLRHGALSAVTGTFSLLSSMLVIAAMVMIGLYLFKKDSPAPAPVQPRYPYQY